MSFSGLVHSILFVSFFFLHSFGVWRLAFVMHWCRMLVHRKIYFIYFGTYDNADILTDTVICESTTSPKYLYALIYFCRKEHLVKRCTFAHNLRESQEKKNIIFNRHRHNTCQCISVSILPLFTCSHSQTDLSAVLHPQTIGRKVRKNKRTSLSVPSLIFHYIFIRLAQNTLFIYYISFLTNCQLHIRLTKLKEIKN